MYPSDYNSGPQHIEPDHHYDAIGVSAGLSALLILDSIKSPDFYPQAYVFTSYVALEASLIFTGQWKVDKEKESGILDYASVIPRYGLQESIPLKLLTWGN